VGLAALRLAFIAYIAYTYRLYLSRDKLSDGAKAYITNKRSSIRSSFGQVARSSLISALSKPSLPSTPRRKGWNF